QRQLADVLRIKIYGNGKEDESVIWLNEEATDGADLRFDAKKKNNDYLNLYSYLESSPAVKYAINGVGNFGCAKTFKLGISDLNSAEVNVVPSGTYTFNFSEFETFTEDYNFTLIDKFANEVVDVKNNADYVFDITTDPSTFGDARFELIITQPDIQTDNVIHYTDVCENAQALITIENTQSSILYEVRDQQGQTISDVVAGNGNAAVLSIPKERLLNGINNLMVYAKNNSCDPVPLTQSVSLKVNEIYSIHSVENGSSCQSGSLTLKATGVPSDGHYYWYETETATESVGTGSEWTTPVLLKSKTYYVAARNALECEGARVPVNAEVIHYDAAAISELEGVLRSSYAQNNQWYFNDIAISGATNQEIVPDKSGSYTVKVNISGCTTSAQYEFSVTSIEEENLLNLISVYPNPVENRVSVELRNTAPAAARIINSVGATIGSIYFQMDGKTQKGDFDLGSEPAGLYLIKILQDKKIIHYKVIKK
ncbi:MAG: T9SS type A sorting domain-containing protein, partial [Cyclobacteriaceae bacterium]